MKPSHWSPAAVRDLDHAASWYGDQGGEALEIGFVDAVESVVRLIETHPGAGSTLHADLLPTLSAPLRFQPVRRFDGYLVYYVELPAHVFIVRIWNASRGMEALFEDEELNPDIGSSHPGY
ncbi:type II toxin-antitoxin system RelE/ParE family toxin [Stenotrophomonas indicatrix]|uniref:type II toxin-antitoxin system RelE/ParE family toxin n=1 Tax=Stenotrophomonas indicatrix TaxID=2045451 RepID=UPI001C501123|nr:type II toxin-antitoxin system RelE/ParE family toxin [Stenotrophomonas indicatrix]QXQ01562.1 type II toxin-antitoxin system RelE/ParE family toxin [Stenotrophomonas indicatrix]